MGPLVAARVVRVAKVFLNVAALLRPEALVGADVGSHLVNGHTLLLAGFCHAGRE